MPIESGPLNEVERLLGSGDDSGPQPLAGPS